MKAMSAKSIQNRQNLQTVVDCANVDDLNSVLTLLEMCEKEVNLGLSWPYYKIESEVIRLKVKLEKSWTIHWKGELFLSQKTMELQLV